MISVWAAPKCRARGENLGADCLFGDESQRNGSEGGEGVRQGRRIIRVPAGGDLAGRSPPCLGKPEQPATATMPIGWGLPLGGLALWTSDINLCFSCMGCSWENILQWNTVVAKLILEVEGAEQGEDVLLKNRPRWLLPGHLLQSPQCWCYWDALPPTFEGPPSLFYWDSTHPWGSSRCHVLCEASLVLWSFPSDFLL